MLGFTLVFGNTTEDGPPRHLGLRRAVAAASPQRRPHGLGRARRPPGSELGQLPDLCVSPSDARRGFWTVHSTSDFCIKIEWIVFALMKCRPYLYIRLVLPSVWPFPTCLPSHPHPPPGLPLGVRGLYPSTRTSGWVPPGAPTLKLSIRLLSSIQSDENTVNALIGGFLVLFHIMCNVVALTFYATIYEDLCCTCNKYIEKAHTWSSELYGFAAITSVWLWLCSWKSDPDIQSRASRLLLYSILNTEKVV